MWRTGWRIQGDGRIVAVGGVRRPPEAAPPRLRPRPLQLDGSLDTSFSGDGKQTTDFGGLDSAMGWRCRATARSSRSAASVDYRGAGLRARPLQPQRLARHELLRRRQADDRLRRSGDARMAWRSRRTARSSRSGCSAGSGVDFALARYNPNGSLDTSFSGDGKQTTDFGGTEAASGVAIQRDGKIVVVGQRRQRRDFALARYNPNGSLDTTFSGDGKQTTDFGGFDERTGSRSRPTARSSRSASRRQRRRLRGRPLQRRRHARPDLLRRRQADDRLRRQPRRGERGGDPGRRQDRRGRPAGDANGDFALARYNPTALSTRPSPATASRRPLRRLRRGKRRGDPGRRQDRRGRASADDGDFALARYNPNGSLDTSFSGDGKLTTDFGGPRRATGVAIQPDGKIVVGRLAGGGASGDFALARYNPNGSLDTSFSGDGKQTTDFGGADDGATGVAIQPDGKIVAVGSGGDDLRRLRARPLQPQWLARHELLRRRQADHRLRRPRRGERGRAPGRRQDRRGRPAPVAPATTTSPSPATTRTAHSTRASPATATRRPTSAATTRRTGWRSSRMARSSRWSRPGGSGFDFAIARYNANGSLDPSFGGDGKQRQTSGSERGNDLAIQPDGRIVAVRTSVRFDGIADFALARYGLPPMDRQG